MKKLIAVLLAAMMIFALTGCVGGTSYQVKNATSDEEAKAIKASKYDKDFKGLQQYLLDKGYIYTKVENPNDAKDSVKLTSEVYYDIIGANDGIRYYFSDQRTFVELYDFSGKQNDTAKKVLADIKDDGKFRAIDVGDELTGVISKSGKYVIIYNAANQYDYAKITDELENW